jgi:hypothetical protein
LLVSAIGLGNASATIESARVFNCTYSMLNQTLVASGLPMLALKHELTELALVEVPPMLRNLGITVMDGPFFSVMPFPARGLHTLSHVRYTPHYAWHDTSGAWFDPHGHVKTALRRSQFILEAPRLSIESRGFLLPSDRRLDGERLACPRRAHAEGA